MPLSFSTPAVLTGRLTIRTSFSGSPSPSVIVKSVAAKLRSVSTPVLRVTSPPLGTALLPRTFTASTDAGATPFVSLSAACAKSAALPPDDGSPVTLASPDSRTKLPDASGTMRMPSPSASAATTVYGPKLRFAPDTPL